MAAVHNTMAAELLADSSSLLLQEDRKRVFELSGCLNKAEDVDDARGDSRSTSTGSACESEAEDDDFEYDYISDDDDEDDELITPKSAASVQPSPPRSSRQLDDFYEQRFAALEAAAGNSIRPAAVSMKEELKLPARDMDLFRLDQFAGA
eukprot:gnl/TRDRNA2_/TRDRNA2_41537_c0_seq1.p1 gnl/TRDRNA2_/TRDRNA2_41537_c0~~gnl/TRDRNA2_/TRDRNA2_41537_c0_seq1.p1  ORF type:complete len:168 (+),score=42.65 gnl/TRDRNA2_/TRDRNA2_41537_c0_seq1:56-505(+)